MRRKKRPEFNEFKKIYYEDNLTVKEIAKKYKVVPGTVYNWANYYRNIKYPSKLSVKQIFNRIHDK